MPMHIWPTLGMATANEYKPNRNARGTMRHPAALLNFLRPYNLLNTPCLRREYSSVQIIHPEGGHHIGEQAEPKHAMQ